MAQARILCAVLPHLIAEQKEVLEPTHAVTYVVTLEEARRVLASSTFDLIVCGVHFDDCQMPLLLHHCKADSRHAKLPFVCIRGYRGGLPDSTYLQIKNAATLLGGVYVDLREWIDMRGYMAALAMLRTLIAKLLTPEGVRS